MSLETKQFSPGSIEFRAEHEALAVAVEFEVKRIMGLGGPVFIRRINPLDEKPTDWPLDAPLNVGCFDTYEEAVRDIRTIRREYRKRAIRIPADKNVIRATCDKPCLVTEIVHDVLRYKFYPEKGEVLGSRAVAYGMEHFARLRDEYFRTDPRYKGNTQSA